MMKIFKVFLVLLLVQTILSAQMGSCIVLDATNQKPIKNVLVKQTLGKVLGFTDSLGRVSFNIKLKDSIQFSHINYYPKVGVSDTVRLNPFRRELPIVQVQAKLRDVVKMTSLVRVYQYIDNHPLCYSEGIVDFFIQTKKMKLSYVVQSLRIFLDKEGIKQTSLRRGKLSMLSNGLFDWTLNTHISSNKKSPYVVIADQGGSPMVYQNGTVFGGGEIIQDSLQTKIIVDENYQNTIKAMNFFGRQTKILRKEIIQSFPNYLIEENIATPYDFGLYRSLVELESGFKDTSPMSIINVVEIYPIKKNYLSKEEYKSYNTSRYWGNFEKSIDPNKFDIILQENGSLPLLESDVRKALWNSLQLVEP